MADRNERNRGDRDEPRGRGRDDSDRGSSRRETSRDRDDRPSRGGRDRDDSRGGRSSGRGSYEYQARDGDSARKRATQGGNDFDKVLKEHIKVWKPNDKDNRIRILPPTWPDAKHFGFDIYLHYGVGPDRGTYLCLEKMQGEADPIAEEYAIVKRDARNEDDDKYAKELQAKPRVLVYLIDRDHEKEGVQAWMMPAGLDKDIMKVSIDKASGEVLQIDHPEDGYDVTFEKNGTGMTTKYEGAAIARRSSPLGKDEWLEFAIDNPLPDQLVYFDYDHIAKIFNGGGSHKGGKESRDRDDADSRSSSSRDDHRSSSRDADSGRGRDDSRGRDEGSSRSRSRASEEPTWDSVHEMTPEELEDLIDSEKLDIDPKDAKDDEDLADWICEEMKLKKVERSSRRAVAEDKPKEDVADRLKRMRSGRD